MAVNVGQRNVPDTISTQKCYAVDATLVLLLHTLKICSNQKIFTEQYKEVITDKITQTATEIYLKSCNANKIRVDAEDSHDRLTLQREAIRLCDQLIYLINVAKRAYHLRFNKVEYWVKITLTTRDLLRKWHDADTKRCK